VREAEFTRLLSEPVDWRYKSMPTVSDPPALRELPEQGWNLLAGDLLFPAMVLKESALAHNIELFARYCREHGVSLAPHAKTPMAPQIVARQLDAGAWGVSVASVSQARVFRAFGVMRILIANEVVQPIAVRWIVDELASDHDLELYCLVDSLKGVSLMVQAAEEAARPIPVLVELGAPKGRTGCRFNAEAREVAVAIEHADALELAGVGGYEGSLKANSLSRTIARVDAYLERLRALTVELEQLGLFHSRREILVSAGGSGLFDRVVKVLGRPWNSSRPVKVILRSGSYVAHDSGEAETISPFGGRSTNGDRLHPAIEIWGSVLSRPESRLAIVGFGKRDVSHDLGLPMPYRVSAAGVIRDVSGLYSITALDDQHAYVSLPESDELSVGDVVGCQISHPCTAFDKWRLIPLVDDEYTVLGAIRTYF
jgi:D-serine deaminase-like pyridoxal phosphate-dependent protein